jgi:hypothetical protein
VRELDALVCEGMDVDVERRWGAGFLAGRYLPGRPSWTWAQVVRPVLERAGPGATVLDQGTGDGAELLALAPLPARTLAQEEWWPTVPAARASLLPAGVALVVARGTDDNVVRPDGGRPVDRHPRPAATALPLADSVLDVVLNRHEAFDPVELARVVRAGGTFVTQQVGHDETASVRRLLGLALVRETWDAAEASRQLVAAGWRVVDVQEERPPCRFTDVAAVLAYARTVPWQLPELDLARGADPRTRRPGLATVLE